MTEILGSLLGGILLGFILRGRPFVGRTAGPMTNVFIYLLVFGLGLSIGRNPDVMSNFSRLGIQAFVACVGGIVGSVAVTALLCRIADSMERSNAR